MRRTISRFAMSFLFVLTGCTLSCQSANQEIKKDHVIDHIIYPRTLLDNRTKVILGDSYKETKYN